MISSVISHDMPRVVAPHRDASPDPFSEKISAATLRAA